MGFELLILNPSEQEGMEYVDPRPGASLNPGWDNYPNASISKSSGRSLLCLSHALVFEQPLTLKVAIDVHTPSVQPKRKIPIGKFSIGS